MTSLDHPASQALLRDVQEWCDPRKTLDELAIHEWVRVAGEWCQVMAVMHEQILILRREHSACEWEYHVSEGEAFMWHPAGF